VVLSANSITTSETPHHTIMLTLITILGALGIFLYGMKVMSEGIQKVAGNGMRAALATATNNRFSALLTGLGITALVQSSSATTVLVVSFVNAGLLTLSESLGVVMGANLGTTVTAWIVATIGVKVSVSSFALPIIGAGLPLFFAGKGKYKYIGEMLIGFGLLFFGLGELKNAVPDLKSAATGGDAETLAMFQDIIHWIQSTGFLAIILFMIAGVLLTLVVQSSSAAMAITIVCALNGLLGDDPIQVFKYSAAIVLGENIGTTVTAWLASIGASVHAKRAARGHFVFNVIGVIWMLALFIPFTSGVWNLSDKLPDSIKAVTDKKVSKLDIATKAEKAFQEESEIYATKVTDMKKALGANATTESVIAALAVVEINKPEPPNPNTDITAKTFSESKSKIAFSIAIFHTCFNLINIFILIWFVPQIASLVKRMVKDKGEKQRLRYISQSLVDMGQLNLTEAEDAVQKMSRKTLEMFEGFKEVFENPAKDMSTQVTTLKGMEEEIDVMMHDITEYLVRCSAKEVGSSNAASIACMLRITAELEECSDSIYRLVKLIERKYNKDRKFSEAQTDAINSFIAVLSRFLAYTDAHIMKPLTPREIGEAVKMEEEINAMRKKFNNATMKRMAEGDVKIEMLNIDINNHLESLGNHALHVVENSAEMHNPSEA